MKHRLTMRFPTPLGLGVVLATLLCTASRAQHTWQMAITVDNHYAIYFGDASLTTVTPVGFDGTWSDTETWNISGVSPSDYLYVATASDFGVLQGFIGRFTNVTTGNTFLTNDDSGTPWEVFPAGAHLAALNALNPSIPPATWFPNLQPTPGQVKTAVQYATANNLWVTPTSAPGFDNLSAPWGPRPGLPLAAEWIWHDSGKDLFPPFYPAPFSGYNHDEFLVFRIPGVIPEPASFALAGWSALAFSVMRRRS